VRRRHLFTFFCFILLAMATPHSARAKLVIHSKIDAAIELIGYETLDEITLFKGKLPTEGKQDIATTYRGLALLMFAQGQTYPIIIGDEALTVLVSGSAEPPSFPSSPENEILYNALAANTPIPPRYPFAALMIQAKRLIDTSSSIHTIAELQSKKNEFQQFVGMNFQNLKHSDIVRRLITQYFMMHEYVDYHVAGAPATDIKTRYQKEILASVADWLKILSPHIPEQKTLNYCVSLYYNRSMVTLAGKIIDKFRDSAYCPGTEIKEINLPGDLLIADVKSNRDLKLSNLKGKKIISFVSEGCPVSMVKTIIKARQAARSKWANKIIVAPLEKLSEKHLTMNRMIQGSPLLFINDGKWRKENLAKKIKLPLFVHVEN